MIYGENKCRDEDMRVLKEYHHHRRLAECKRHQDLRPGYLGLCISRKYMPDLSGKLSPGRTPSTGPSGSVLDFGIKEFGDHEDETHNNS